MFIHRTAVIWLVLIVILIVPKTAPAEQVAEWDFTKGILGWTPNPTVNPLESSPEGLLVTATGQDPWIEGPPIDLPAADVTRLVIRMKSTADTAAEIFYGRTFTAGKSVRFDVRNDGQWHDYSVIIADKLGEKTRFRLDPCLDAGQVTLRFIKVEAIEGIRLPELKKPQLPEKTTDPATVKSGQLELEHFKAKWGGFALKVNGKEMAAGRQEDLIGFILEGRPQWLNLEEAQVTFQSEPKGTLTENASIPDSGGATWRIKRTAKPAAEGSLIVEVEIKVDKDRDVVHIPYLAVFPGLGTFGKSKYQGIFPGLEYLCDEPASSTADIAEPHNIRRTPDPVKITFPMMAVSKDDCYIGLIWQPSEMIAPTFDSPDRIYNSDAHLIALTAPAVGTLRFENAPCAHSPFKLNAGATLNASVTIIGGKGKTIIPAVKQYVRLRGLPPVPQYQGGLQAAAELLAHGWLDSKINNQGLFRHAVWGTSFGPQPAADAPMYIDWLTDFLEDDSLRNRLSELRKTALAGIPQDQPFSSSVGHVRLPAAPFVFGRLAEFVRQRRDAAMDQLKRFDEKGILTYEPGGTDYSRTHFAKHANGFGGRLVADILQAAALSGDKQLTAKALELLDKQTALYADTVPRGAQTWEIPLHTPDILASAHMVKAYTIAYIISQKDDYLEQARYWAWTGVPFVYLHPPTPGRVGSYATIAVLGGTNWQAPVWFGQPVQWCGLVYGGALHMLAEVDPQGPWKQIAKGITAAGLQMTWPVTDADRQGLLPDYFLLRPQISDGPAINPGTVQANIPELFAVGKIYDFKKVPARNWFVHAPSRIGEVKDNEGLISIAVDGCAGRQYRLLISGMEKQPAKVEWADDRKETIRFGPAETQFHPEINALIITLNAPARIKIEP
ncbi:MAG: hypothetical protein JW720_04925 [Sedimentisphaerales bacterium]|nr:hypothetical protein [Sedimentisphaerales bacterium]